MTFNALSDFALAQLAQFRLFAAVEAGDLVSKSGRDELMSHGYVAGEHGRYWLTPDGIALAARMADGDWFNEHKVMN